MSAYVEPDFLLLLLLVLSFLALGFFSPEFPLEGPESVGFLWLMSLCHADLRNPSFLGASPEGPSEDGGGLAYM
jgi:hypothetical protein